MERCGNNLLKKKLAIPDLQQLLFPAALFHIFGNAIISSKVTKESTYRKILRNPYSITIKLTLQFTGLTEIISYKFHYII